MMERTAEDSQRVWARVAGFALLAIIVFGLAAMALQSVSGSGSTMQSILAHERRYRVGLACGFVMLNNDILLAVALYGLLKPWNATLALLGTLWRFANAAMLGVGIVAALTALHILAGTHQSVVFRVDQVQDLSNLFMEMNYAASPIGLFFWSMGAAVHSYLLWKSKYIPRLLSGAYFAVAVMIFLGCFAIMIFPLIRSAIDPWFVLPDLPVELAVAIWLVTKGARIQPSPAG